MPHAYEIDSISQAGRQAQAHMRTCRHAGRHARTHARSLAHTHQAAPAELRPASRLDRPASMVRELATASILFLEKPLPAETVAFPLAFSLMASMSEGGNTVAGFSRAVEGDTQPHALSEMRCD